MTGLLRRIPLWTKLVAAVLALMAAALVAVGVASTAALRSYLVGRVDGQLAEAVHRAREQGSPSETGVIPSPVNPTDFLLEWRLPGLVAVSHYDTHQYSREDLPPRPATRAAAERLTDRGPYTVDAANGSSRWRMQVTVLRDGSVFTVGQNLAEVELAVNRLIWAEVLIGAAVLALLAIAGVTGVRTSLRPLRAIERTAGAIAGGDLARRVPDPEAGAAAPRTEVGRLARALNAMLAQIEAAFAARRASEEKMRQFVADASHELRTPLTSIRGFAELYRQGAAGTPEERAGLVSRIEDEAARMGLLVEDLLLLARLDRERPLAQNPVELPAVVADAVHAAQAVAPDRRITLEVPADGEPLMVRGDDARLRQVVGNLVTNGMTHTPPDTQLTVRLRHEPGSGAPGTGRPGAGVIEVVDQGPGLSQEQAARVFERFYRVDAARSRPSGGSGNGPASRGTGLGLAIVAALVAAHRGTVEVDSTPGAGATFRVRLPLVAGDANRPAESQAGASRNEG